MKQHRWLLFGLLAFGALLFFVNLGGYDLWPADEPRFGEVAREMMQSGDYLAPHVNGEPYKEKPPLLFWLIAAASAPFGDVTEFSARVPSALAALVTVLCTFLLASRLYGPRVAFWSAVVLMTGLRFWWQARTAQIDMVLTACMSAALLSFWMWHTCKNRRWLVAFYAAIALGVYAKGPAAIIFPLLMIFAFFWRKPAERRQIHWVLGTLAVVALIAIWLIPARMAVATGSGESLQSSIGSVVYRQMIGRFFMGVSKAQPPWYYATTIPVDLMPWTLLLPYTLPWVWRRRKEEGAMRLLLSWIVPALIFFSICSGKRAIYILPLFPVFAILIARSVLDLTFGERTSWRKRTGLAWGLCLLVLGSIPLTLVFMPEAAAASWVARFELPDTAAAFLGDRALWRVPFLVFGVSALWFALDAFYKSIKTEMRAIHATLALHFAGLALVAAVFVLPAINPYKTARAFCEPLRVLAQQGQPYRLYSVAFTREEYVFYAQHFHEAVLTDMVPPPESTDIDPEQWDAVKKRLRGAINKAVVAVPIDSIDRMTDTEFAALRDAFVHAIASAGTDPAVAAFETALRDSVRSFAKQFDSPEPAFMFIQEEDWRTFLPVYDTPPSDVIVRHSAVGRRSVLLIANPAAAALTPFAEEETGNSRAN